MLERITKWLTTDAVPTASVEELRQAVERPAEGVLFVDVRTKEEWKKGHITGFRNIPMKELAEHIDELNRYPKIYFLCHSGGRSGRACALLAQNGHTGAVNVLGGWAEWVARGYPVEL